MSVEACREQMIDEYTAKVKYLDAVCPIVFAQYDFIRELISRVERAKKEDLRVDVMGALVGLSIHKNANEVNLLVECGGRMDWVIANTDYV